MLDCKGIQWTGKEQRETHEVLSMFLVITFCMLHTLTPQCSILLFCWAMLYSKLQEAHKLSQIPAPTLVTFEKKYIFIIAYIAMLMYDLFISLTRPQAHVNIGLVFSTACALTFSTCASCWTYWVTLKLSHQAPCPHVTPVYGKGEGRIGGFSWQMTVKRFVRAVRRLL